MKDHYRVFISSTYLDNVTRRNVVLEAIERTGRMVAVRMERFTADDRPTVEVCLSRAAECELFMGIIAHRYGWGGAARPGAGRGEVHHLAGVRAARSAGKRCTALRPGRVTARPDLNAIPNRACGPGRVHHRTLAIN